MCTVPPLHLDDLYTRSVHRIESMCIYTPDDQLARCTVDFGITVPSVEVYSFLFLFLSSSESLEERLVLQQRHCLLFFPAEIS